MRRLNKYDLHPDNPYWADILKFELALRDMSVAQLISNDYVREKLQLILKQKASWHPLVEKAYDEIIERARNGL
jgi:hypothetical protein